MTDEKSSDQEKTVDKDKLNKIKEQIEYYLSDKNLETDPFFQQKINESEDGFIDLYHFQNCNKVINAGWTLIELLDGIRTSDLLELNDDCSKIRRRGNPPLPPLNKEFLLRKKRQREKENSLENAEGNEGENNKTENDEGKSEKKQNRSKNTVLKNPITLGGIIFTDLSKINEKILHFFWSAEGEDVVILTEEEARFVKDLAKFHEKRGMGKKINNCEFIGAGKTGKNKENNRFYGMDKDKNKKFDFSLTRAIQQIKRKK